MIKIARSEFKSYTNVRTLLGDKDLTRKSIFIHAHTHTPVVMVTINFLLWIKMNLSLAFIHVLLVTMVTIVIHKCIYMFIIMNIVH